MTYARSFENFTPPKRYDGIPFTSINIGEGATTEAFSTIATVALEPVDVDAANPAARSFTTDAAALERGWYRIEWVDDDDAVFYADPIYFPTHSPVFAEVADVEARLGRELAEGERDAARLILEVVSGMIWEAADKDVAWASALEPVPALLRALAIEKAVGAVANPTNLASASETLGAYSYSETYPRALDVGVFLTADEERAVRRAVYGSGATSATVPNGLDLDPAVVVDLVPRIFGPSSP